LSTSQNGTSDEYEGAKRVERGYYVGPAAERVPRGFRSPPGFEGTAPAGASGSFPSPTDLWKQLQDTKENPLLGAFSEIIHQNNPPGAQKIRH